MVIIDITVSTSYTIITGNTGKIECAFTICRFVLNVIF